MPLNSGLYGPHLLTTTGLSALSGVAPGAYVLGAKNTLGGVNVNYVGRADVDLIARLEDHVAAGNYTHFKYAFYETRIKAYRAECALFHMFGAYTLDNKVHPASPKNLNLACSHPGCGR